MINMPTKPPASKRRRDSAPAMPPEVTEVLQATSEDQPRLIVGIGASAGGLEAFKSFFEKMAADSGMAFVLVQHLAPQHTSLLAELVGRSTAMPVTDAIDGERVRANHVYVIQPDTTLTIADGALQVSRPAPPREQRWPINTFFTSLAEDQGDCAVCIVLSGTGSDGAIGLRAIKQHGGLTLAQSGFDHAAMIGMPASAAATGLVDHILPVEDMPARLVAHHQHVQISDRHKGPKGERQDLAAHLQTICNLLHSHVGHDFSQYKEKTLVRRIQRRMHVVQTETVPDYIAHLRTHPEEHQRLFREVLIGVTEFFRDPKAFEALQSVAIPALLEGKTAADTVRVWVPGCATGEEAYSIAIALKEAMGQRHGEPKVQIFATDIDDYAITAARAGRYKAPLVGVSEDRRKRWFRQSGDDWHVVKAIREMCIFSPHSAIKDPPFSRIDLVSCRNLLIYLNPDLQERLTRTFHYALRAGGYLLLGPSESLARNAGLFSVVDKSQCLYLRSADTGAGGPMMPVGRNAKFATTAAHGSSEARESGGKRDLLESSARQVLEQYAPAFVVIDDHYEILRFAGDTGRYLGPSTGTASLNLFALLHRGLRIAARVAVKQAMRTGKPVVHDGVTVATGSQRQRLRLIAAPLPNVQPGKALCVVAFDELEPGSSLADFNPESGATESAPAGSSAAHQALERELASARIDLQAAIEQQEAANEEMKSSNEEYQSVNEELQSANEELETSKEELQSINEELQTLNSEMHDKNAALAHANSDLQNLLDSTKIATLFLDAQLRVRNFTPAMTEVFHLRENDRGRPINEIAGRIEYADLQHDVAQVLRTLAVVERELEANEKGVVFLLRMRPYRTTDNVIDGVVLTFLDISERRQHEFEHGRLAAIVESSLDMIIGHALDGTITSVNASVERSLGYAPAQLLGKLLSALVVDPDSEHAQALQTCMHHDKSAKGSAELEIAWRRLDGSVVQVALTCSPVIDAGGRVVAGSLIARDISERARATAHTQLLLGELNHRVKNTLASVQAIALQSVANATSLEQFRDAFVARLLALSNTHNLLADDEWRGVGLREVVYGELVPYERDGEARYTMTGDTLQLTPKAALAFGMAVHELATNAAKYGALSVPEGHVDVQWMRHMSKGSPWLQLLWTERGGPTVAQPTHRGFGTRLVSDGLAYELDGKVTLAFEPSGVTCRFDVPLTEIEATREK